jgi:hypothetical protein
MFFATLGEDEIPSPPCRGRISGLRDRLYISYFCHVDLGLDLDVDLDLDTLALDTLSIAS